MSPTRGNIAAAAERIAAFVRPTPIIRVRPDGWGLAAPRALKRELLQHAGSFHPRGNTDAVAIAP